ncbi:hypothetical protein EBR77_01380 [bacterium]|nr:hypothetical protein [bacterium]NBX78131.1 hypothetical protein [bacterium]
MEKSNLNPGFSFLEIIIVITLSSILFATVIFLNQQVTSSSIRIDKHLDADEQRAMLYTQLFNDIAGMSILIYDKDTEQKGEEKKEPKKVELKKNSEKEKQTGADRYFYSENTEEQLNFITFITTNSLQFYSKPKQRFTRVVYKARKNENGDGFTLYRKEIDSLLFDNIYEESWQGYYPILSGVKKININYYIIKESKDKQKGESDKPELIDIQEWGVSNKDGNEDDFDLKIPRFLKFTYELTNGTKDEIWFKTPLTNIHAPKLPGQEKAAEKSTAPGQEKKPEEKSSVTPSSPKSPSEKTPNKDHNIIIQSMGNSKTENSSPTNQEIEHHQPEIHHENEGDEHAQ